MTNLNTSYEIDFNDFTLRMFSSVNRIWNAHILTELKRQTSGLSNFKAKQKYIIDIRDIESCTESISKFQELKTIPNQYSYYLEDNTHIFFSKKRNAILYINDKGVILYTGKTLAYSIPFLITLIGIDKDYYFIHSAGVVINDKSNLMFGYGGIGKTATLSQAYKQKNIKVMGDDLNLIYKDGLVSPYYRPFCIYQYHRALFPQYFDKKTPKKISKPNIFNRIIRKLSLNTGRNSSIEFNYNTISIDSLFEADKLICEKKLINKIIFVERIENVSFESRLVSINSAEASMLIFNIMLTEYDKYIKDFIVLLTYMGISFDNFCSNSLSIINNALNHASCIKLEIDKSVSPELVGKIILSELSNEF